MLQDDQDNLVELQKRCLHVRASMNENLPPHELAMDDILVVKTSSIPNAGQGLFYEPTDNESILHSGTIICYYAGHRHNFLSQKNLADKSYLLNVSGNLFVDPGPLLAIKARYINDPLNDELINCEFVPQPYLFRCAVVATRDIKPKEELFVSYGEMYWSNQSFNGAVLYH